MALRDIQSNAQKALERRNKQLAASTVATQSGGTSTPTTTETPKVTPTPKSVQSTIGQRTTNNISNIKNIRAKETGDAPDLFSKEDAEPYQSHLSKWFGREPGEKTQGAVTNLFDKLRPGSEKAVNTLKAFKTFGKIIKEEGKEETKGFDKWYTPEGLKQYFNYGLDELSPLVRPMVGNAGYTSLDTVKGVTNWIDNTIDSIDSRIPDEGLLVRKGILESSKTQEEIEADKKRKKANREAIAASILDTVNAGEQWLDNTEIGKEVKSVEGKSLVEAIEQGDTEAARRIIGNNIGYMLPSVGAGIVGGDVGVAVSIFPVTYQDTLEDYMSDESILENSTPEEIHWMATTSAALQTAIEIVSLETQVLKPLRNSTASKELSRKITQPVVSRVIGQWLKGSLAEGVEEISQQFIEEKFAQLLGSNRELLTVDDYANIGLEAFIMGLIITGPGAVVEGVSTKRQKIAYNENIRKIKEAIPGITEEEAEEILNTIIDYEEKKEDITKLENKATKLYDNKQNIQTTINELQQNPTDQNKYQIQLLEKKIQDIDESISKIDKKINDMHQPMQDINDRLNKDAPTQEDIEQTVKTNYENMRQSELDRLKAGLIPGQQSTPQQQGGENLSKQTMPNISTIESKKSDTQRYYELSGLGRRQLDLNKSNDAKEAYETVDKLKGMSVDEGGDLLSKYDYDALQLFRTVANNTIRGISEGRIEDDINVYNKILEQIDKAEQIQMDAFSEKHIIKQKGLDEKDVSSVEQYSLVTKGKMFDELDADEKESVIAEFVKQDTNYSKHLVGLKGTSIKDLTGEITDTSAHKFSRMIARVSQLLGIDFNKVISGVELNVTKGKKYNSLEGFLTKDYTKEQLTELANRMAVDGEKINKALSGVVKAGIFLAEKKNISIEKATAILAHEFFHLLDFKKSVDSNKPLVINNKYELDSKGNRKTSIVFDALLEGEDMWYTYETNSKQEQFVDELLDGTASISDYKKRGFKNKKEAIDVVNYLIYLRRGTEVLSRYTEQYVLWKTDKKEFNKITKEVGYWTEDEFNKLKDVYEDIVLKDDFKDYELDESNRLYADLMEKLDNYMAKKQFVSDEKWLSDIEKANPKIMDEKKRDEIKNTMLEMEKEYVRLSAIADGLEGDIRTEIWNEYQVALSMLNTNLDMINRLKDKYVDMTTNTKEQQAQIDEGVNNVSDNGPELISEVKDNQQEGDVIDDAMKEEIEEDKEPDTTEPLDVAVNNVVNKVERSVDKMIKDKNKKNAIREVGQGIKDVFTPALSRLYSISPRLAGAVHVYQASVGLKTLGYKRLSENFVKELDKLKKKNPEAYKKLSLALFDWGMDESIDIKQSLKDAGLDGKLFEPVVSILNQIATEYQSAGLDITINDKYFPRKVKDYGLLLDYLSRKSGKNIEGTKEDLLNRIKNINEDPSLSDGEKEVRIHNILINEFTKPSERSNNAKERKLVLSEWLLTDEERKQGYKNDITDFYEDPIVSLSNYIDDMVKKTELKKMLGGLTNEKTAISEEFDDSIAKIILDMEARGELTPEKAEEAKKVIKSIVNARATGKWAQGIKNAVYSMTIANRLSAAQQLEDLSKALLRGPTGFKNIVKAIIGKANIKMDDTGLENAFAQFEGGNITDVLFKLSGFDAVDALGKNSFLNTAYDSCVRQANSERRSIILKTRLTQMYGEEMGNSIFESYKNNELRDEDGHLKLDVMIDLMYQLGNTQPIYKSAMPTAYLNNPKIRVVYCLWSFTVKQVDWFIQGTKEVYNNQRLLGKSKEVASMAATGRCIGALSVVSIISAMVSDLINWAKGDDDELMFKKWREEGFGAFIKQFGINSLSGLLKIFNISKYDQYIFKREGIGGVLMSKITPAPVSIFSDIGQVLLGKEELASMGKYMPLFLKPLYYQFKNRDMLPDYKLWGGETETKKSKGTSDKFGKTSVGTQGPSNSSKFGGYSVQ